MRRGGARHEFTFMNNTPAIVSGLFGFFILCCAYAAQYWAFRSCRELRAMNAKLDRLLKQSS